MSNEQVETAPHRGAVLLRLAVRDIVRFKSREKPGLVLLEHFL
jgi:hypothetical protein